MSEAFDEPPLPGRIDVGEVIATGARAVGQNFVTFCGIAVLVQLPAFAMSAGFQEWLVLRTAQVAANPYASRQSLELATSFGGLATQMVETAFLYLAQATLMFATVEFLAGRKASIGASLAGGLSRIHVVLAVALLETIAVGLGCVACCVPGILLMCVLYVSVPAAVCEQLGPIEAMQRSADLTTGHRIAIFLIVFLLFIVDILVGLGISVAYGDDLLRNELPTAALSLPVRLSRYGVTFVVQCILTMFQAAFAAVFYARIRGIRDGVDANAIADVFA